MKQKVVVLVTCLIMYGCLSAQLLTPAFVTDSLERYIEQGLKDWNIPGLAIAIVKDGKIVISKGYGVSDINTNEAVTENTLFMIASNSKLFTGTALAQLEANKKLQLDDKISKYIPGYKLYDPNATDLVTIRDMLSHRIGTKTFQGDFVFWNSNLSRSEIINRMKLMKPSGNFRQTFGYCNSCFLTAAEIIPVVTGKPWEVYVYDSLIVPLGMTNTHTLSQGMSQRPNASKPYTNQFTGKLTEVPYDQIDNIGPAGSMVSNVKDMSNWLLLQLDSGKLNGKRVLPWEVIRKTRDINTIISSRKSASLPVHFTGYGLGVFMNDYAGRQVYYHTGGADGFVTNTCFVPEERLGIVILTNNDNQAFFEALRYQLLDAYMHVPFVNRSKALLNDFNDEMKATITRTETYQQRVKNSNGTSSLNTYVGTYNNPLYGKMVITKDETGKFLNLDFKGHNNLKATLKYMDENEWLLTYNHPGYGIFSVQFKSKDNVPQSLEIRVNEFLDYDSYTFTKN